MAKVVLITGCSAGIGRLTAELFATRGWSVVATARRPEEISLDNVTPLRLDVTDEASIASAVASTVDRFGGIDVLVNNAGYGLFGPLEGAGAGEFEAQIRTNLLGAVSVICHVLPVMRAHRSGVIVNVSSIAGRVATPFMSGYNASKFALEGLSESLRFELSLHSIRVKLVEPAHFKTGFVERSLKRTSHPAYDAPFENFMGWVRKEDAKAPDPAPVAEAIYRAANDTSHRLRYPVKGKLMLALVALFPDSVWRLLNEQGMKRPAN
jgi:NAD(P)-dependent dehydrogenase (short-subunit alcohol dehydrogenase family)